MNRILVLDPESQEMRRIPSLLETQGYLPVPVSDVAALHQQAAEADAIVCMAARLKELAAARQLPTLLLDSDPSIPRAVAAIKAGAADYLPADADQEVLLSSLARLLRERPSPPPGATFPMVGISAPMKELINSISKVAPTNSTVLITGESGTGKELVARALHAGSQRRYAPLISLNCATVPDELIETELFGHPGEESRGLLETAAGGTLFLDEIGELPMAAQSRLLQAIETGEDIRLISASHRDLDTLVSNGHFRDDLYYRLKVVSLSVPPLRNRADDVLLLADAILGRTMEKLGKENLEFTVTAREDMRRYRWPGNVRELENAIQRAVILCEGSELSTELLAIDPPGSDMPAKTGPAASPDQTIEDYFVNFVTTHQDNMTETELAEKLGISRKSLWERRQRLNIPRKKTPKRGRRRDVT